MAMANHKAVEVDPKELENSKAFWNNFLNASKYATIAVIVLMIGLALAFVKFT